MPYDIIKYANMGIKRTVSTRQIDLWGSEPLESKKIKHKMQIIEMSIFPLYFLGIPLYRPEPPHHPSSAVQIQTVCTLLRASQVRRGSSMRG